MRQKHHRRLLRAALAVAPLCCATAGYSQIPSFAAPEAPVTAAGYGADLLPKDVEGRADLLRTTAFDATIYGMAAYLQYEQLYRQVFDRHSPMFTGFSRFAHERDLAGPDYATFKVPNTDTLYSNAWIDLTRGPVEIQIPATQLKYFTLNIFDIFGNPSNLSNRTVGKEGGRFLLVPRGWQGTAAEGVTVYHAATPQLWILMRVFAQSEKEVRVARAFQDAVRIIPPADDAAETKEPMIAPPLPGAGATAFLGALDYILRINGCQAGEEALVSRFRPLGILADRPFDAASLDQAARIAIEAGYAEALALITKSRSRLGEPTGTGWMKVNKGIYGYNYLRRSVINMAGLGANVREENASYTTFVDGSGAPLDGAISRYTLRLQTPPPVNGFWSVTLYDAKTFALYPNPLRRYLVSDRTKGLRVAPDGSVRIHLQHARSVKENWLPAPAGPFFVVIRAYSPKPEMLNGQWLPPAIAADGTAK
ncbi:DUF1254 domain-containing protein [Sphingomonas sanxanigenens]|uniref:DUF1254 domain-containing protein n=1 Tax=Sphingomonas sanxanigenens DSM 19645 = NX02 TaxID=1123269 RepID=W0ABG9_9SPHN|nr:DUF1254 domain-containing protein [Sphingomonas sanxanigenens]AHE52985.1 hypothetical protein NX02_06275 [Sphingomonas sanxanigenens DSM 19645 = NX02]